MNLFELCHENLDKPPSWNPCLRKEFHKGKHNHNNYCNDATCSCGSILKRMSKNHLNTFESLKNIKNDADRKMNLILKKYEVREEK